MCIHKIWYMQFLWFSIRSYVTRIEVRYIVEWILKLIKWLIHCCFTSVYAYYDKGTAGNHEVERGSIERVPTSAHLLNKNFDVIFFCHQRPFALLYVALFYYMYDRIADELFTSFCAVSVMFYYYWSPLPSPHIFKSRRKREARRIQYLISFAISSWIWSPIKMHSRGKIYIRLRINRHKRTKHTMFCFFFIRVYEHGLACLTKPWTLCSMIDEKTCSSFKGY